MSGADTERRRHVLVALDASGPSMEALDAACQLARELDTELRGLFVEDARLLGLARIPGARVLASTTARAQPFGTAEASRLLRSQARRARRALAEIAGRLGVAWEFEVVRGDIAAELLARARDAEFVGAGLCSLPRRRGTVGSTALALFASLSSAPTRGLLLLAAGPRHAPTVQVVHDGGAAARRAVSLAARLAGRRRAPLVVTCLGEDEPTAAARRAEAEAWLREEGATARLELLVGDGPGACESARRSGSGWLVLPADGLLAACGGCPNWIAEAGCPVLLVR